MRRAMPPFRLDSEPLTIIGYAPGSLEVDNHWISVGRWDGKHLKVTFPACRSIGHTFQHILETVEQAGRALVAIGGALGMPVAYTQFMTQGIVPVADPHAMTREKAYSILRHLGCRATEVWCAETFKSAFRSRNLSKNVKSAIVAQALVQKLRAVGCAAFPFDEGKIVKPLKLAIEVDGLEASCGYFEIWRKLYPDLRFPAGYRTMQIYHDSLSACLDGAAYLRGLTYCHRNYPGHEEQILQEGWIYFPYKTSLSLLEAADAMNDLTYIKAYRPEEDWALEHLNLPFIY